MVEHATENRGVASSILALGTTGVEHAPDLRQAGAFAVSSPAPTSTNAPTSTATSVFTPTPTPSVALYVELAGSVVIEAERYRTTSPGSGAAASSAWSFVTAPAGYVGEGVMQALPNRGVSTGPGINGPALNYTIQFTTPGTYYVYLRGQSATGSPLGSAGSSTDNSIHVGLNGTPVTTGCCYGVNFGGVYEWQLACESNRVMVSIPSAGIYTVNIWMREDGVVVDRLWLSTSSSAIPEDRTLPGPPESGRATPTPGPTSTASISPRPIAQHPVA